MYETFGIEKNNKNHYILSLSLAFSGTIIAIFFQKVNSYIGLLGGTAGVMMVGTIPMICYFKLFGLKSWREKAMGIMMVMVSLLAMIGAFLSVIFPS